jgi:hypothetical protein
MGISDILSSLGSGINGVANGLGGALFPNDPNQSQYVDPAQSAAARNNALISLGLGIMRAPYSMTGMGSGLLDAYQGSQQGYQSAMDNAFKHTLIKRELDQQAQDREFQQQERAIQLKQSDLGLKQAERADRTQAATVAQRVLKGLSTASDPTAYLGLIQNDPDVKDAFSSLGIQTPYVGPMSQPGNLEQFRQQLATAASAAPSPTPIKLSQGDVLLNPNDPSQVLASAAPKGDISIEKGVSVGNNQVQDFTIDHHTGQRTPISPPYTSTGQQRLSITSGNLADWTPEALDQAAESLRLTGKLPSNLGKGSPVVPQLYAMAAAKAKAQGQDSTAAVFNQQAFHAGSQAMGALTKQQNMVGAFEATANKNLDLALQLSANVDRTGSPLINRGLQAWRTGVTSDPDTKAFVNALVAARTEYAKVLSGATGSTGVTDSARHEAEQLFSTVDSPETLQKVIGVAKQEMRNRMDSFTEQQARLKDSLTGAGPAPTSAAPTAPSGTPAGADGKPLW